ncbi:aliphatic sulfonate ABC transporter substrate-binding protein [Streptomyces sp. B6B3]|uniref:aliphatic sulfonate ABC transporter substrate-binding protein n=1 Tax=Streptomyces sp. B6B3 TaxID=3153570 RepID=UPI00325CC4B3
MRVSRRTLLTTASATLAGLALPACGSGGGSNGGRVRFGYIADFNGASLLAIAERQDLWKRHDLSPTTEEFTNGPLQVQALGAGDLDFGYIGPGALWLPASGQTSIVAINTLTKADRVIARSGITSVADLADRQVGVPEGTSGEMILNLALRDAGMSLEDVQKVPMDPSTVVSAFSSGQIEAAGIWYPLIDTIKGNVPDLVEVAATDDFPDHTFPTAFVAGNGVDSELAEKVVGVLQEANDWRAENPDEAVRLTAEMLDLDPEAVASDASHVELLTTADLVDRTDDGTVVGWLDGLNEIFADTGQLSDVPDATSYYSGDVYSRVFRA